MVYPFYGVGCRKAFLYRMPQLNDMEATPQNVWGHGLDILDIKVNYDEDQLDKILQAVPPSLLPTTHLAACDGVCLVTLLPKTGWFLYSSQWDYQLGFLCLRPYLPVEFSQTKEGKKINQNTKDQQQKAKMETV